MTAPWAGTPFEAEYHRLHDKVERLEEEVHLWHSCVHEPGEIDERLRENATLRVKVERLEARCDELNEACAAKQVLIDHTASDLRDMRDLYEREKGELRAEVELLKARLRAERIPLAGSDCTCKGFIISDGRICGGCARNLRLALADCEGAYVRLSREQDTLRGAVERLREALRGILAITDRKHVAWDAAHAALAEPREP